MFVVGHSSLPGSPMPRVRTRHPNMKVESHDRQRAYLNTENPAWIVLELNPGFKFPTPAFDKCPTLYSILIALRADKNICTPPPPVDKKLNWAEFGTGTCLLK